MDGLDASDLVVCNGIDGSTGGYALKPVSVASVAARARELSPLPDLGSTTRGAFDSALLAAASDLSQVGWGVIFARDAAVELRAALGPLLERRAAQAEALYREFEFDSTCDDLRTWLSRHDVAPGVVDCELVPFYLLIVGSPRDIPFEFQYLLDLSYAVGRVSFDTLDEYRAYARSVVEYERAQTPMSGREVAFWAPRHDGDAATNLSSELLIAPLLARTSSLPVRSTAHVGPQATKAHLLETLHRARAEQPPALIFTASHGVAWPSGHERQRALQGGLLAQDWRFRTPVNATDLVAAQDLGPNARIWGSLVFAFACYGAGTPELDSLGASKQPRVVAEQPFVAALPQRLLAHEAGGALAFIGHVDRAWGFSVRSSGSSQIHPFKSCVDLLLRGFPVGFAMNDFSARYATLSASLLNMLSSSTRDGKSERELARAWIERTDSQSYVVLGDPAVRLRPELLV